MSTHNVEVYRCRACGEKVVTVGLGLSLTDEELEDYTASHKKLCTAQLERIVTDED